MHIYAKDYWTYKLHPVYYEKCNFWSFQYSCNQIQNNRLSVIPNLNLITKIDYSRGPIDFIKNHPLVDIPLFELNYMIHPSSMVANTDADFYALNLDINMSPTEFYGKEFQFLKDKLLSIDNENNNLLKIPKIIHQIYFDPSGPSELLRTISQTWKKKHPGWEYRFWDGKAIEQFMESDFPDLIPLFRSYPFDVQRWDFVRYLILYRFGGLYVDLDYECIEPLDALLWNCSCCLGMEPAVNVIRNNKSLIIGNALMACIPNHDFFANIIKDMSTYNWQIFRHRGTQVMESTGPFMLNRVYESYDNKDDITLLPAELITPLSLEEVQHRISGNETAEIKRKVKKAFAIHYFLGSWVPQLQRFVKP